MNRIRNIIFDWGGVITNIDFNATIEAFNKLGVDKFEEHYCKSHQSILFQDFEVGKLSPDEFRESFRLTIHPGISDEKLDEAWFAMLKDTPVQNIELITNLKSRYRIFLLSNTNEIHVDYYNEIFKKQFGLKTGLRDLFEKAYYSHEIGYRKPSLESFQYVINNAVLSPSETVFIDDSLQNIKAAEEVGINSLHFKEGCDLISFINHMYDIIPNQN